MQVQGPIEHLRADAALCPTLDVAQKVHRQPRALGQAPLRDITGAYQVQHMLLAPQEDQEVIDGLWPTVHNSTRGGPEYGFVFLGHFPEQSKAAF